MFVGNLDTFEEVANIKVVSAYQSADNKRWEVGRAETETCWWRSEDRTMTGSDARTDWRKIDLSIPSEAGGALVRPVVFKDRLFVGWFEFPTEEDSTALFRLAHMRYDDSWSVPKAYPFQLSAPAAAGRPWRLIVTQYNVDTQLAVCLTDRDPATPATPAVDDLVLAIFEDHSSGGEEALGDFTPAAALARYYPVGTDVSVQDPWDGSSQPTSS
ncbi:neuraminidase-like domain-containing protein [Streptomyces sp. NPDC127114]|uniref:neuraminidase-like domain-containing protein n=1 Tax=Streptomyces sp. NPDC127114 TaxID=3345366 RepID=UPI00362D5CC6